MYYIIDRYNSFTKRFAFCSTYSVKKDAILRCMKLPQEGRVIEIRDDSTSIIFNNAVSGNVMKEIRDIVREFNQ